MAKQFKATHPGKRMEVEVSVGGFYGSIKPTFVEWCKSGEAMLKLKEDADVAVTDEKPRYIQIFGSVFAWQPQCSPASLPPLFLFLCLGGTPCGGCNS